MARNLSSFIQAELVASTVRPFFLFECILSVGVNLRLWDGFGPLDWNGWTWEGNGWFKGFPEVPETNDSASASMDIVLSGVPQALIASILNEATHASRGSVYLGFFNATNQIISTPYLCFEGLISSPRINDAPPSSELVLSFVDELVTLNRPRELRYNSESHKAYFPSDLFFDYVPKLADWTGFFGNKTKPKKPGKNSRNKNGSKRDSTNRRR